MTTKSDLGRNGNREERSKSVLPKIYSGLMQWNSCDWWFKMKSKGGYTKIAINMK